MKKFFLTLCVVSVFCFPLLAIAQTASDPLAAPAWLLTVISVITNPPEWLVGLPVVGKFVPKVLSVILTVFKWTGFVGAVMTALSVCVQSILKLPEIAARWAGAAAVADKIASVSQKIMPWLKYFSIFNVQKPPQ